MFIKCFLLILFIFVIVLGLLNGLWLHLQKENDIINIFIEVIKIVLPVFALISLFLSLDYNSFWFIVYVSIYYVLEAIYNLLSKISLKDTQGNKFYPNVLGEKTKKMLSSFTIVYALCFHLLIHNTICNWFLHSIFINIVSVIGLLILGVLIILGVLMILYDFYTIIEFPIFNNLINKTIKNIDKLTYKKLYKKVRTIDKLFVYVFKPEIDTQFNIKSIALTLQSKYSQEQLNTTLSKKDQEFIIESLSKFQNSYIK
ncbi:MAG: hypothetical protein J6J23_07495 [Clostridia bacterium]|nr:hypothetical protein [Clostridia bacterium]